MGVDLQALQQQIEEKKQRERDEKAREAALGMDHAAGGRQMSEVDVWRMKSDDGLEMRKLTVLYVCFCLCTLCVCVCVCVCVCGSRC